MTTITRTVPLTALLFAGLCAGLPAQAVDRMPANATPAATNLHHLTISLHGFPEWRGKGGYEGLMREAESVGDVSSWLLPADPELKAADSALPQDATRQWAYFSLKLTAGPGGLATGCVAPAVSATPTEGNGTITPALAALAEALCRRITPRAHFHPALDQDGKPVAAIFSLLISLRHDVGEGKLPTIEAPGRTASPPMLMPTPSVDKPGWPPSEPWLSAFYSRPEFAPDMPVTTTAALADHAPWAGVVLAGPDTGQPFCTLAMPSGVPKIDRKACDFARRKVKPVWIDAPPRLPLSAWYMSSYRQIGPQRHHVPMIVTLYRDKLAAIPPREAGVSLPLLSPAAQADLVARVAARWPESSRDALHAARLELRITSAGKVPRCYVENSTGSDAGDIAYCRTMRDEIIFDPARDVFGVPRPEDSNIWFRLPTGK